jgi:predicted RNase H-like HicB family nuclease
MTRKFNIALFVHSEGVSVSCPDLPGCFSQGATVAEARENIGVAIREYLETWGEPEGHCELAETEVAVG